MLHRSLSITLGCFTLILLGMSSAQILREQRAEAQSSPIVCSMIALGAPIFAMVLACVKIS